MAEAARLSPYDDDLSYRRALTSLAASPECITSTSTGNTNTTETDKADEPTPSSGIEVPPEGPSSTHDPTPAGPGPTFNSLREPPELRAHVDGRIKNLVPTRLQGVATSKIGNFAVMHIDVNGTMPSDRSTAARRTSEGTEAQARRAIEAGWQPIRRARSTWHSDDLDTRPLSNPSSTVPITAPASSPPLPPADGPTPQEAKAEQARLLTLLRTLHPLLVVEQLCRGLAYFGGIPGAPPPTHGDFPQSAARNGRGSLLVGWLSEIFPHVDKPDAISPPLHLPPLSSIAGPPLSGSVAPPGPPTGKRPRGRPKGSKSSKVRKDKGVQKRQLSSSIDASSRYADASQQATVVQLNISAPTNPTPRADSVSTGPQTASGRETTATTSGNMAAGSNPASASGAPPTLTGRKRGRPKGSKNRLKSIPETSHEASGAGSTGRTTTVPTTANLLPAPSNFPGVGRSLLMGSQNGFIATQSSLVNVPQDVASLPPPAAMECSPSNGVPPPLVTRDPSQLQSQSPRTIHGNQHPVEPENGSPSRVRVSKRAVQDDNEVSADDPATDEPQTQASSNDIPLCRMS
ncbi:hypothetical protein RJ55_07900 [Drechmeria coniospora]|nr:hypothetical protein RJ55_07900 [Drechmeria coniospora]